jgi:hypothetical protein
VPDSGIFTSTQLTDFQRRNRSTCHATVIFVELKDRNIFGNAWIKDGDEQLRSTIAIFENTTDAYRYQQQEGLHCQ